MVQTIDTQKLINLHEYFTNDTQDSIDALLEYSNFVADIPNRVAMSKLRDDVETYQYKFTQWDLQRRTLHNQAINALGRLNYKSKTELNTPLFSEDMEKLSREQLGTMILDTFKNDEIEKTLENISKFNQRYEELKTKTPKQNDKDNNLEL